MKEVVPKDSRYVPMTQQVYCCVPTCFSIIMYKMGIPLIPQELLGSYLGLTIPKDAKKLMWNIKVGKPGPAGFGTRIDKMGDKKANEVFKKNKIPLRMKIYNVDKFSDQEVYDYLMRIEKEDIDVLACFENAFFTKEPGAHGHACVIDRVDPKKKTIRLIDPSFRQPKWRIVKIKDLISAMRMQTNNASAGFWELSLA
jgi:hypothetical protein